MVGTPGAELSDLLDAFQTASSELTETKDMAEVAELALGLALELTESSVAFIRLDDDGGERKQVFSRATANSEAVSSDWIDSFVAATETQSSAVSDTDSGWGHHLDPGPRVMRSYCGRQLRAGGKVIGVIGVGRETGYSALQGHMIAVFANQVAAALEIARLRDRRQEMVDVLVQLRADLDRSEKQRLVNEERARSAARVERAHELAVAVLLAVSSHVRSGHDLTDFYRRLTATIAQLVGAGRVLFWQLDDNGMLSAIPGGYGIDDSFITRLHPIPCLPEKDDLVATVVFRDHIFRASRTDESAEFSYVLDALGVRDAISAPWRAGDQRLGLVAAYDSDRPEGFSREDGWVLQKAGLAAALVWQLKHAETDLVKTVERLERVDAARQLLLKNASTAVDKATKRIASQLHDDALQKLTAAELQLQRLQVPGRSDSKLLGEAQNLLAQTEDALRRLLFEVRPPALELQGGLEESIRDRLTMLSSLTCIQPEVELDLRDDLSYEIKSIVFRQVAEAVTNIEKHSAATKVKVALKVVDGGVLGLVVDNGRGFVVSERDHLPGHIGLLALKERAQWVGGWINIDSEPGCGTKVEFWMPTS